MDTFEAIASRRSVRRFKPDPVSREQLEHLVAAGRLAPTAHNEQPWEFVVMTDPERRRQLAALTDYGKFIVDAPACLVVLCRNTRFYVEDGSAATATILLAAADLGLGTCWVAGDKKTYAPRVVELCGAPPEMKLVSLIAVGVPEKVPLPPKRPLATVLHWEMFKPASGE